MSRRVCVNALCTYAHLCASALLPFVCVCVTPALCQLLKAARPHCVLSVSRLLSHSLAFRLSLPAFPLLARPGPDWLIHWFPGVNEKEGRMCCRCVLKGNFALSDLSVRWVIGATGVVVESSKYRHPSVSEPDA